MGVLSRTSRLGQLPASARYSYSHFTGMCLVQAVSGLSPPNVERRLLERADSRGLPQTSRKTQDLVRPAWSLVDSSVLREWIKAAVLISA